MTQMVQHVDQHQTEISQKALDGTTRKITQKHVRSSKHVLAQTITSINKCNSDKRMERNPMELQSFVQARSLAFSPIYQELRMADGYQRFNGKTVPIGLVIASVADQIVFDMPPCQGSGSLFGLMQEIETLVPKSPPIIRGFYGGFLDLLVSLSRGLTDVMLPYRQETAWFANRALLARERVPNLPVQDIPKINWYMGMPRQLIAWLCDKCGLDRGLLLDAMDLAHVLQDRGMARMKLLEAVTSSVLRYKISHGSFGPESITVGIVATESEPILLQYICPLVGTELVNAAPGTMTTCMVSIDGGPHVMTWMPYAYVMVLLGATNNAHMRPALTHVHAEATRAALATEYKLACSAGMYHDVPIEWLDRYPELKPLAVQYMEEEEKALF
jgi:hypothetical protein